MSKLFSLEEGTKLVKLARKSINFFLHTNSLLQEQTQNKFFLGDRGVFVTLSYFPSKELKGCIGFPYPTAPLWNAVIESAASAAFRDPRFPSLQSSELEEITIEISILTQPKEIKAHGEKLLEEIEIGRDGLMAERGVAKGLLLPQVPLEWKWKKKEFLEHTCLKAGMEADCWMDKKASFYSFQAQIFKEEKPSGKVMQEKSKKAD